MIGFRYKGESTDTILEGYTLGIAFENAVRTVVGSNRNQMNGTSTATRPIANEYWTTNNSPQFSYMLCKFEGDICNMSEFTVDDQRKIERWLSSPKFSSELVITDNGKDLYCYSGNFIATEWVLSPMGYIGCNFTFQADRAYPYLHEIYKFLITNDELKEDDIDTIVGYSDESEEDDTNTLETPTEPETPEPETPTEFPEEENPDDSNENEEPDDSSDEDDSENDSEDEEPKEEEFIKVKSGECITIYCGSDELEEYVYPKLRILNTTYSYNDTVEVTVVNITDGGKEMFVDARPRVTYLFDCQRCIAYDYGVDEDNVVGVLNYRDLGWQDIGNIYWLRLKPGENILQINTYGGNAEITIEYDTPYKIVGGWLQ